MAVLESQKRDSCLLEADFNEQRFLSETDAFNTFLRTVETVRENIGLRCTNLYAVAFISRYLFQRCGKLGRCFCRSDCSTKKSIS